MFRRLSLFLLILLGFFAAGVAAAPELTRVRRLFFGSGDAASSGSPTSVSPRPAGPARPVRLWIPLAASPDGSQDVAGVGIGGPVAYARRHDSEYSDASAEFDPTAQEQPRPVLTSLFTFTPRATNAELAPFAPP